MDSVFFAFVVSTGPLLFLFATFFSVSKMMCCCAFHAFSAVSCLFSNFVSGFKGTPVVSSLSLLVHSGSLPVLKAVSLFTNRCSSNPSNPDAGDAFSSVNGVPISTLVKSLVPHFVFLFNFYRLLLFCFVLFCFGFVSLLLLLPVAFAGCTGVSSFLEVFA